MSPQEPGVERPLLDKLGVRAQMRVSVLGVRDDAFLRALRERGADVSLRRRKGSDLILYRADGPRALAKLARLEPLLERDGAIWSSIREGAGTSARSG